jgi:hypothetical protein
MREKQTYWYTYNSQDEDEREANILIHLSQPRWGWERSKHIDTPITAKVRMREKQTYW